MTTILSLRLFDQVYIMTRGGPLNATTTGRPACPVLLKCSTLPAT